MENPLRKKYIWNFMGQVHAQGDRATMLESLKKIKGDYFCNTNSGWNSKDSISTANYKKILKNSVFTPCPRGNSNAETFRLYESLETKSIPILEKDECWSKIFGEDHPLMEFDCWRSASTEMEALCEDPDKLIEYSNLLSDWWAKHKTKTNKLILELLEDKTPEEEKLEATKDLNQLRSINLHYWPGYKGKKNFGDELSPFIMKKLLPFHNFHLNENPKKHKKNLIALGSYLHEVKDGFSIFGSGSRKGGFNNSEGLELISLRGPNTKKILNERGVDCPEKFGDPALFMPRFYKPKIDKSLSDKIGFVPHFTDRTDYGMKDDQFHIIKPTLPWQTVIDKICSCKAILSSSLHGLICADAYRIPNAWLKYKNLDDGEFKFKDYFLSQEREFKFISDISEISDSIFNKKGNTINLDELSDALYRSSLIEKTKKIAVVYRIPKSNKEKYSSWRDGFTEALKILSSVYDISLFNIEDGLPSLDSFDWIFTKEGFGGDIIKSIQEKKHSAKTGIFVSSSREIPTNGQLNEFDIVFYETDWYYNHANLSRHNNCHKAFGIDDSFCNNNPLKEKDIDNLFVGAIAGYKRPWEITKHKGVNLCIGEIKDKEIESFLKNNNVLVYPFVKYEDLSKIYERSKNCIVPCSTHGGGERAVLEARAHGVPVITSNDNDKLKELVSGKIFNQLDYAKSIFKGIELFSEKDNVCLINPSAVEHKGSIYTLYRTELYPQNCPSYYTSSTGKKINFYRSESGYVLKNKKNEVIQCKFIFENYSYSKSKMVDLAETGKIKIEDIRFIENSFSKEDGQTFCLACCTVLSDFHISSCTKDEKGQINQSKPIGMSLKTSPGICKVNLDNGNIFHLKTLGRNLHSTHEKNWLIFKSKEKYCCIYSIDPLLYKFSESVEDISFSNEDRPNKLKLHNATCPIEISPDTYGMVCHSKRYKNKEYAWGYDKRFITFKVAGDQISIISSHDLKSIKKEYYCSSIIKEGKKIRVFAGTEDTGNTSLLIDIPGTQNAKRKNTKRKVEQFLKLNEQWKNFKDYDFFNYTSSLKESNPARSRELYICNPGKKIAIVSLHTEQISSYAIHSEKSISQYCEKQNYTFYSYREKIEKNCSANWSKSQAILNHISDHDYIIWMDSDTLVFNPSKKFEDILTKCDKDHLIIATKDIGENSMLNSGVLIFSNSDFSKKILKEWRDFSGDKSHLYASGGDQEILCSVLKKSDPEKNNLKIFEMSEFNTDPRFIKEDTFIVHFMAYPASLKTSFMGYFMS